MEKSLTVKNTNDFKLKQGQAISKLVDGKPNRDCDSQCELNISQNSVNTQELIMKTLEIIFLWTKQIFIILFYVSCTLESCF